MFDAEAVDAVGLKAKITHADIDAEKAKLGAGTTDENARDSLENKIDKMVASRLRFNQEVRDYQSLSANKKSAEDSVVNAVMDQKGKNASTEMQGAYVSVDENKLRSALEGAHITTTVSGGSIVNAKLDTSGTIDTFINDAQEVLKKINENVADTSRDIREVKKVADDDAKKKDAK